MTIDTSVYNIHL